MAIVPTPTIPAQPAGTVAASADMNTLAGASQFLLNKPITMGTGSASLSTATGSQGNMTFTTASIITDTDGMWVPANSHQFTCQRYGLWWLEGNVKVTLPTNTIFQLFVGVYAGANNPFQSVGLGVFLLSRFFIVPGTGIAYVSLASVMAAPCFPGDAMETLVFLPSGAASAGSFTGTQTARWVGLP